MHNRRRVSSLFNSRLEEKKGSAEQVIYVVLVAKAVRGYTLTRFTDISPCGQYISAPPLFALGLEPFGF